MVYAGGQENFPGGQPDEETLEQSVNLVEKDFEILDRAYEIASKQSMAPMEIRPLMERLLKMNGTDYLIKEEVLDTYLYAKKSAFVRDYMDGKTPSDVLQSEPLQLESAPFEQRYDEIMSRPLVKPKNINDQSEDDENVAA